MMTRTSPGRHGRLRAVISLRRQVTQTPRLVQTPPRVVVVMDPQLTELLAYQSALRS